MAETYRNRCVNPLCLIPQNNLKGMFDKQDKSKIIEDMLVH